MSAPTTKKRPQKPWLKTSALNAPARREQPSRATITERAGMPRLLDRHEVVAITGVTYQTLWAWMRADPPKFPRSRIVGEKSKWLSSEVMSWIAALPTRRLKGDPAPKEHETV